MTRVAQAPHQHQLRSCNAPNTLNTWNLTT
jgi:hypothetical protein